MTWSKIRDGRGRITFVVARRFKVSCYAPPLWKLRWKAYDYRPARGWMALRSKPWGPHNSRRDRVWASSAAAIAAIEKMAGGA